MKQNTISIASNEKTHLQKKIFLGVLIVAFLVQAVFSVTTIINSNIDNQFPLMLFLFPVAPLLYILIAYLFIQRLSGHVSKLFYMVLIADACIYVNGAFVSISSFIAHPSQASSFLALNSNTLYFSTIGLVTLLEIIILTFMRHKNIL